MSEKKSSTTSVRARRPWVEVPTSAFAHRRLARFSVIGAICCLLSVSTLAGFPAAASSLPARAVSPHRHFPVPWAPGGTSGYRWPGPFGSGPGSLGTATVSSAPVGAGPSELAFDSANHTVYVANGYNNNGPYDGGNTVSMIDTRHCQAQAFWECAGPWPTVTVGNLPSSIAVDQATGTVYVTNTGDNTVTVLNGATCNAVNFSGCRQQATVPVGLGPLGIFADDTNHTVYVADLDFSDGTTVSMINSATCNANTLATCPTTPPPTVAVAISPLAVTVDLATHTVYVSSESQATVFDADTCNATVQSGCSTVGTLSGDPFGNGPNDAEIDTANNTLYAANYDDTISAFDLADCDAANLVGCATAPAGTVSAFPASTTPSALYVAVDVALHTVYVTYAEDDSVAVVDTNICNGANLAACSTLHPPLARTGAAPEGLVLDPQTQTLYVANEVDNDVSVIDAWTCNAKVTIGCRLAPAAAPVPWGDIFTTSGMVADTSVSTLYASAQGDTVAMVNTRTCNRNAISGCTSTPLAAQAGTDPGAIALDPLTHTIYVANFGSMSAPGTVTVINASTCNATDVEGCPGTQTLTVPGANAVDIAVDATTDTIYVAATTDSGPNLLAVFNGATCNSISSSGCSQTPATSQVGDSGGSFGNSNMNVAVNDATNTVYVTNIADLSSGLWVGDGVYVVDGATCDAANTTGCGQAPAIITGGLSSSSSTGPFTIPWGIAIDEATDTVYVALQAAGDYAGNVLVVDGAICNGSDVAGCNQVPPTVPVGYNDFGVAVDPTTNAVYVTNLYDASVSVIDGALCNASISFGCRLVPPKLPTDHFPASIAIDAAVGTAYVHNEGSISVVPLLP